MSTQLLPPTSHPITAIAPIREPSLLPAAEVAKFLAISVRTLWRLDSAGQLPLSVTIGNSKRWRRDELSAWVNCGCPPRAQWQWGRDVVPARASR